MSNVFLPDHADAFLGPETNGEWGGVPWERAVLKAPDCPLLADETPWQNRLAIFPSPDGSCNQAIIAAGPIDDDADGPGGSPEIDPCWQPDTSLRWLDGSSIDSRTFRGIVMHRVLEDHGARLGDIVLTVWGGVAHFGQAYDIGPTRKFQEGAEHHLRLHGVITPEQSAHHAACEGNDVTDFCCLTFVGSAPLDAHGRPYALAEDELIALGWQLWNAFTNRPGQGGTGAAVVVSGVSPAAAPTPPPASAEVGLLALISLTLLTLLPVAVYPLVAEAPAPGFLDWIASLGFLMGFVLTALKIREMTRPNPPLHEVYAKVDRVERIDQDWREHAQTNLNRIKDIERSLDLRHQENVAHLTSIEKKVDSNHELIRARQDDLTTEIRHDVRQELQAADLKAEGRFERQIDRMTDVVRGLGRVEGGGAVRT